MSVFFSDLKEFFCALHRKALFTALLSGLIWSCGYLESCGCLELPEESLVLQISCFQREREEESMIASVLLHLSTVHEVFGKWPV